MHTARRTHGFTESVIRGMTRLANQHGAINLGQGFPNFPCPDLLKEAAARAIREDVNQYAITWGAKRLRDAVAAKYGRWYGLAVDPETELTVIADYSELSSRDDVAFATELVVKHGVATVPVSSFHAEPDPGRREVRFAFCKTDDVLAEAARRLEALRR